jgi:hypothetical protein
MSNLTSMRGNQQPLGLPTPPQGQAIATYGTYAEAQKAVDYLSDNHFPVQAVTIVGVGLQMVERITGRMTYARAAFAGMGSGIWFGIMIGFLLTIFGRGNGVNIFVAAIIVGAAFGGLFALFSYALTGGRRDFTSTSQIVASEYRVLCLPEAAGRAIQLLGQLQREGGPGPSAGSAGAAETPAPDAPVIPVYGAPPAPAAPAGEETVKIPSEPVSGPTYGEMIDRKRAEQDRAAKAGGDGDDTAPEPDAGRSAAGREQGVEDRQ